jgi:hypothetical protein
VVADTVVADTVVAAISDAAGNAAPAGVAGQGLPEPYVPGSGDRVPAELRLVLAGYVGIAGGLFATALVCAAAAAVLVFFGDYGNDLDDFLNDLDDLYDGTIGLAVSAVIVLAASIVITAWVWGLTDGLGRALKALKVGIRFSRLLRRPSDTHMAAVMASKRGGRRLIFDIPWDGTGRGY